MEKISNKASIWLGLCLIIGLGVLGFFYSANSSQIQSL